MSDLDTFEEMIFTDFFNIYSTLYMEIYLSESDEYAKKFEDFKKIKYNFDELDDDSRISDLISI